MYEWKRSQHPQKNGQVLTIYERHVQGVAINAWSGPDATEPDDDVRQMWLYRPGFDGSISVHLNGPESDAEADRIATALSRLGAELWPQPMARDEQAQEVVNGR